VASDQPLSRIKRLAFSAFLLVLVLAVCEGLARLMVPLLVDVEPEGFRDYYRSDSKLRALTWTNKYVSHPYFGYVSEEILEFENALSDLGDSDFVIGITGGSVAGRLAVYLRNNPAVFDVLRDLDLAFGDRKLRIVNLAMGGGKQPQQFFVSAYFLEHLDLVINVDGLNDVVPVSLLPVYPLEYPLLSLRFYEREAGGQIYAVAGRGVVSLYKLMNRLPIRVAVLGKSYLYFAFYNGADGMLSSAARALNAAFLDAAIEQKWAPGSERLTDSQIMQRRLKIWEKYTALQSDMLRTHTRGYYFLQPNQYVPDSKPLSEEELRIAVNDGNAQSIGGAMQRLRLALPNLNRRGIPVHDLTNIFSSVLETVYKDDCCHLNRRGNAILAGAIVTIVAKDWASRSIAPTSREVLIHSDGCSGGGPSRISDS